MRPCSINCRPFQPCNKPGCLQKKLSEFHKQAMRNHEAAMAEHRSLIAEHRARMSRFSSGPVSSSDQTLLNFEAIRLGGGRDNCLQPLGNSVAIGNGNHAGQDNHTLANIGDNNTIIYVVNCPQHRG